MINPDDKNQPIIIDWGSAWSTYNNNVNNKHYNYNFIKNNENIIEATQFNFCTFYHDLDKYKIQKNYIYSETIIWKDVYKKIGLNVFIEESIKEEKEEEDDDDGENNNNDDDDEDDGYNNDDDEIEEINNSIEKITLKGKKF
ncbi:hypothetical protein M0812_19562 [Anaeramoeba flamelloides]|uniref:Uncharacterized protein n=1 Tax=Anaeramoeba flamelloides TaxID=1746091 RepID=A0AAV7Z0U9_9EUKA|nr:hypothetical protein M0812_19562 [Anaeramoeba flamelloides]